MDFAFVVQRKRTRFKYPLDFLMAVDKFLNLPYAAVYFCKLSITTVNLNTSIRMLKHINDYKLPAHHSDW